jgi:hypothetical protein
METGRRFDCFEVGERPGIGWLAYAKDTEGKYLRSYTESQNKKDILSFLFT